MDLSRAGRVLAVFMLVFIGAISTVFADDAPDQVTYPFPDLGLSKPKSVATDAGNNIYIADTGNNKVVIVWAADQSTTIIGEGTAGFFGDNAPADATKTKLNAPEGVAVDASGNLYIADTGNHRIRMVAAVSGKVTASSRITTIAGNGAAGFYGDAQVATAASLNSPTSVAVDAAKVVYIADKGNYRVRKFTAGGNISTIAGDGSSTTLTAAGITVSKAGDLYIADSGHNTVWKMTKASGALVSFAGTGIAGYSGDGGLASHAALNQPSAVSTDGVDLYVADTGNNSIRKVSLTTLVISTRAGQAVFSPPDPPDSPDPPKQITFPAIPAAFASPTGVALDSAGNLYVADLDHSKIGAIAEISASISARTTASIPGGSFVSPQNIILTTNEPIKGIYFTADLSAPDPSALNPVLYSSTNTSGTFRYNNSLLLSTTTTIRFMSVDLLGHSETPSTATYAFVSAPSVGALTDTGVNAGVYYSANTAMNLTFVTSPEDATVYYTMDGKVPTTSSAKNVGATGMPRTPIQIPVGASQATTTLKYFAADNYGNSSTIASASYTTVALATTASIAGGYYRQGQSVTLTSNDSTAIITYSTAGDPSDPALLAADPPLAFTGTGQIPAIIIPTGQTVLRYFSKNGTSEAVKSQTYNVITVPPTVSAVPLPLSTTSINPITVAVTSPNADVAIYYTLDGKTPTITSLKYATPITINSTTTLTVVAVDKAGNQSIVTPYVYKIDLTVPTTTAAPKGGLYDSTQTVSLTTDDPTAKIYYTLDGSSPSSLSQLYSKPIIINQDVTLKFSAIDPSGNQEPAKSEIYTVVPLKTSAYPTGGAYSSDQFVSLASNTANATIYYTIDGTTPTKTSTKYTGPIHITDKTNITSATTTLQFLSIDKAGFFEVFKTEVYTIDTVTPSTTFKCNNSLYTIKLTAIDSSDSVPRIKYVANTFTGVNSSTLDVSPYTLTDYTSTIYFGSQDSGNNTIVKYFAVDAAGNTELVHTGYCSYGADNTAPTIFLETPTENVPNNILTQYVIGNVAPFTTKIKINGNPVDTNTINGAFSYRLDAPTSVSITNASDDSALTATQPPVAGSAVIIAINKNDNNSAEVPSIGVIGNRLRVPIYMQSGFQAAAANLEINYDKTLLTAPSVELSPLAKAFGKVVTSNVLTAGDLRMVITDANNSSITPIPDGVLAYLTFDIVMNGLGNPGFVDKSGNHNIYTATDSSGNRNDSPTLSDITDPSLVITTIVVNNADPNNMATDLGDKNITNVSDLNGSRPNGTIKIVKNIGDINASGSTTLDEVLKGLLMLVDPIHNTVDNSAADINGDGQISIWEMQRLINSFVGLN